MQLLANPITLRRSGSASTPFLNEPGCQQNEVMPEIQHVQEHCQGWLSPRDRERDEQSGCRSQLSSVKRQKQMSTSSPGGTSKQRADQQEMLSSS